MQHKRAAGILIALLIGCDSPTSQNAVGSVEITPAPSLLGTIPLTTAEQIQLHAEVKRLDGSTASNVRVVWQSFNSNLATVDSTGLVRTAATYASCNEFGGQLYSGPIGCSVRITATAGGRSDTTFIFVRPRVVYESQSPVTVAVGDSVRFSPPVATVDGAVACTFFPVLRHDSTIAQLRNGHVVGIAPGETGIDWMPHQNLCRGQSAGTVILVFPR